MSVIRQIVDGGLKGGQVVSVNLPPLRAGDSPAGVKVLRQCTNAWIDTYEERVDPRGRSYFWNNTVFRLGNTDQDTDVAALRDGYITVTPLQFDLTNYPMLREWQDRKWSM
jgi:5'-nucleotidase